MFSWKNNIYVWSSIDCRFFKCVNQSSAVSVSRLIVISSVFFCSISSFQRPSRCEAERLVDHSRNVYCYFFFSKRNATRDWNRKGSLCGGVLGQLSHEVLLQHCFSSVLRLNDHTSNLFLTIAITLHLFKVIKHWKARDQRSKSSKQSNIHHTSPPELSVSLVFYSLCYRISGSTSSLLAHQCQRFFKTS